METRRGPLKKIPFFWAFMIVYLAYVLLGFLLMYIFDNKIFLNDEFPQSTLAGFIILSSALYMVVPGIAAHYVHEKARRNWYVWICPLVLMLINVLIWLIRKDCTLSLFPLCCGMPLAMALGEINNAVLAMFVYMVFVPSIIYSFCILLARLFSRRPKAKVV